jgi:hypothetical protein
MRPRQECKSLTQVGLVRTGVGPQTASSGGRASAPHYQENQVVHMRPRQAVGSDAKSSRLDLCATSQLQKFRGGWHNEPKLLVLLYTEAAGLGRRLVY